MKLPLGLFALLLNYYYFADTFTDKNKIKRNFELAWKTKIMKQIVIMTILT